MIDLAMTVYLVGDAVRRWRAAWWVYGLSGESTSGRVRWSLRHALRW